MSQPDSFTFNSPSSGDQPSAALPPPRTDPSGANPDPEETWPSWYTVVAGALLLAAGVFWLLDVAGVLELRWRIIFPAVLVVIGIALVVLSVSRRTGPLQGLGFILVLLMLIAAVVPDAASNGVGERNRRPTSQTDLDQTYSHGIGQLTIDLRDVRIDRNVSLEASVVMGELTVRVPRRVRLYVNATAGIGDVRALGSSSNGFGAEIQEGFPNEAVDPDSPVLTLNLSVGIGQVEVRP